MTDNEIIKALECCGIETSCKGCPYHDISFCQDNICKDALDLINRQKADIEMLNGLVKSLEELCETKTTLLTDANCSLITVRAKAIKEFAERVKERAKAHYFDNCCYAVSIEEIDNLVEEMVGEE